MEFIVLYDPKDHEITRVSLDLTVSSFTSRVRAMIDSKIEINGIEGCGWLVRIHPFVDVTYYCFVSMTSHQKMPVMINGVPQWDAIKFIAMRMLYSTPHEQLKTINVKESTGSEMDTWEQIAFRPVRA